MTAERSIERTQSRGAKEREEDRRKLVVVLSEDEFAVGEAY